jgi:hypothetical protein
MPVVISAPRARVNPAYLREIGRITRHRRCGDLEEPSSEHDVKFVAAEFGLAKFAEPL